MWGIVFVLTTGFLVGVMQAQVNHMIENRNILHVEEKNITVHIQDVEKKITKIKQDLTQKIEKVVENNGNNGVSVLNWGG